MPYDPFVIESEPAVIYRLSPYADSSAVASAVSSEHGKIKLFIKNAYSKKGAPVCLMPGSLSFSLKNGGLHRFRSFAHNPDYYHYIKESEISLRLSLCFDFFDQLFYQGEFSAVFWKLILKFTPENFRELSLYIIYRLLKDAGFWFYHPCLCGKMEGKLTLNKGVIVCESCAKSEAGGFMIAGAVRELLPLFENTEAYRTAKFSPNDEREALNLFAAHLDTVLEKKDAVKSLKVLSDMSVESL
jgi:recombinational DNA repair protein (RecF pathway)